MHIERCENLFESKMIWNENYQVRLSLQPQWQAHYFCEIKEIFRGMGSHFLTLFSA